MFKNLPVISALAPVGGVLWVVHPTTSTAFIAAGTVGAALVEHKLRELGKARRERKAVKAAAKEQLAHEQEIAEFMAQNAPQALPKPAVVIDYTQAGQAVTRRV